MNFTRYGRIEADPLRIPTASATRTGAREAFASHLDEATAMIPSQVVEPTRKMPAPEAKTEAPKAPARREDDAEETSAAPATATTNPTEVVTPVPIQAAPVEDSCQQAPAAGEGDAPAAGRGGSRPADAAAADLPAAGQPAAPQAGNGGAAAFQNALAIARVNGTAARAGNDGRATGTGQVTAATRTAPTARTAPAAGYRTVTPQSAQLLDQARDSVFKQILFKLGKEDSEMRVRLEPPELGQLDLHMVVGQTGQMQLVLGAERQDLAAMLDRNLDELVRTLQASGLDVTHAEVRTQTGGAGEQDRSGNGDALAREQARNDEITAAAGAAPRQGYITAQGLDFWV